MVHKGTEPVIVKWISYVCLVGTLALLMGCRTPQPNLKPDKTPEVLNAPPQEARYETSEYPKLAFDEPKKLDSIDKGFPGGGSPRNGMSGSPGGIPGR